MSKVKSKAGNIVEGLLQSNLMQRAVPYRLILPQGYYKSRKNYPVLYLLHGLFGCCDNWVDLTNLCDYVLDTKLIIVLPEGGNGWYTDSVTVKEDKFESYITEELIPEIDLLYKTNPKRESRFIGGLSMGGFGALKFALKKPDLFAFAFSISGAFSAPQQTNSNPGFDWENLGDSILKAFGEEDSPTRSQNDLFQIIKLISDKEAVNLPDIYMVCGMEDEFLKVNRKLAELLRGKKISFEYSETSGSHDWNYWDKEIHCILPLIERKLRF